MRYSRLLAVLLYYSIARNLPRSFWPGGYFFSLCRVFFIRLSGCVVGKNCEIEPGIDIGLKPKLVIGDRCQINMNVSLRNVHLGNAVMIAPGCVLLDRQHVHSRSDIPMRDQEVLFFKKTILEDDVWLGQNVIVMPGLIIGKGAIIGAGSVVTRDIPSLAVAVGIPAKVIRFRSNDDQRSTI